MNNTGQAMRGSKATLFVLPLLSAVLFIQAGNVPGQTLTTLHSFTITFYPNSTNMGFANPYAGLVSSGSALYGTTLSGGSSNGGMIFRINADGTGFTNLHSFAQSEEGAARGRLLLSDHIVYGTTSGSVFKMNSDGTSFATLHSFSGKDGDGANALAGAVLFGNTLYGTTFYGGSSGYGTVFKINTDGTGFAILHSFSSPGLDNRDGASPCGRLVLSEDVLYGTAVRGGLPDRGTVFSLKIDGTEFRTLHTFDPTSGPDANTFINSNGAYPHAGLVVSGNALFGTAEYGGSSGVGTVFKVNLDGSDFQTLHNFSSPGTYPWTNSDGATPVSELVVSGDRLYGTARAGGRAGNGTVFALNTDGSDFTTLHHFSATYAPYVNSDGASPTSDLLLSGNTLYGTTGAGGLSGCGTVFSISFPPPRLSIVRHGASCVLRWPIDVAGFSYADYVPQSSTNLQAWTSVAGAPANVSGQNFLTNTISGSRRFFRLSR